MSVTDQLNLARCSRMDLIQVDAVESAQPFVMAALVLDSLVYSPLRACRDPRRSNKGRVGKREAARSHKVLRDTTDWRWLCFCWFVRRLGLRCRHRIDRREGDKDWVLRMLRMLRMLRILREA